MSAPVKAAAKADLPPGGAKLVTLNGVEVALFNANGKYCAVDNTCHAPHSSTTRRRANGEGGAGL